MRYGGAPLDLIVKKYQGMRALIYRTAEYMKNSRTAIRGEPDKALKDTYRPLGSFMPSQKLLNS